MAAEIGANPFYERDPWGGSLFVSVCFHALVGGAIFASGILLQPRGINWGDKEGESVDAKLVASAPVPLPRPAEETPNIVANESRGKTETPPEPKPAEAEEPKAVPIPEKITPPKTKKPVTVVRARPRPTPTPETAAAYGEGGPARGPYGMFTAPNMKGGFSFENADFGSKYAWYVEAVKRKVQSNWLTYELDPNLRAPHRGGISFDILRDGSVTNVQLAQSSGVPILDQSAFRAVQRVDTFGPLPEGSRATVTFWFDYPPK